MEKIIVKVRKNKSTGQKSVTIPKESKIEVNDYVEVNKIK